MYINYSIKEILKSSNELQNKIDVFKDKQLQKTQYGFRKDKSTADAIITKR